MLTLSDGRTLEGIHRITLPLPFYPKAIQCYLVSAERTTLIDCGIKGSGNLKFLRRKLEEAGTAIEDIDLLVITHAHIDHCGQALQIKEASGCEVAVHRYEAGNLEDFPQGRDTDGDSPVLAALLEWGVPEDLVKIGARHTALMRSLRDNVTVDRRLEDGDVLDLGEVKLETIHVPGHSAGQIVLHDPARRLLFSADHLLPDISPVPLLQFYHGLPERPHSLVNFMASVRKVDALELDVALPSHGEPILDVEEVVEGYRLHTEKRQLRVERILRKHGPITAYEAAELLFSKKTASGQWFLCLSEIIGHLELLERRRRIGVERRNGLVYYNFKKDY